MRMNEQIFPVNKLYAESRDGELRLNTYLAPGPNYKAGAKKLLQCDGGWRAEADYPSERIADFGRSCTSLALA